MGTTRHFQVVFDGRVLDLNLSNVDHCTFGSVYFEKIIFALNPKLLGRVGYSSERMKVPYN